MKRNNLSLNEVINLRGIYHDSCYDRITQLNTMGCSWIGTCQEIFDALHGDEHTVYSIDNRYVIFRDHNNAPTFIQSGNRFINPFWILN